MARASSWKKRAKYRLPLSSRIQSQLVVTKRCVGLESSLTAHWVMTYIFGLLSLEDRLGCKIIAYTCVKFHCTVMKLSVDINVHHCRLYSMCNSGMERPDTFGKAGYIRRPVLFRPHCANKLKICVLSQSQKGIWIITLGIRSSIQTAAGPQ